MAMYQVQGGLAMTMEMNRVSNNVWLSTLGIYHRIDDYTIEVPNKMVSATSRVFWNQQSWGG